MRNIVTWIPKPKRCVGIPLRLRSVRTLHLYRQRKASSDESGSSTEYALRSAFEQIARRIRKKINRSHRGDLYRQYELSIEINGHTVHLSCETRWSVFTCESPLISSKSKLVILVVLCHTACITTGDSRQSSVKNFSNWLRLSTQQRHLTVTWEASIEMHLSQLQFIWYS